MRIRITFNLDTEDRAAINYRLGKDSPATRDECARWIYGNVVSLVLSAVDEHQNPAVSQGEPRRRVSRAKG